MKVLWLSRHSAEDAQVAELERIFAAHDTVETVEISQSVKSGQEVIDLMASNGCDEAVVVLPPNLLAQVIRGGYRPLRAVMDRKVNDDGSVDFIFSHFEKVMEVKIITEKL